MDFGRISGRTSESKKRLDTLHNETIAPVTMESTVQEIRSVEGEIQGVTREIEAVTQELNALNLSDEDKRYFRQEKDRLRQEKDRLRQKEDRLRQKELILLQRSSPAVLSIPEDDALGEKFMSDRKLLEDLHRNIVKRDRATPQITPASHGRHESQRLEREGKLKTFTSIQGESSILSPDEVIEFSKLQTEHQMVAFITPHLEMIFRQNNESSTVVVNSEEYKWLRTSDDTNFNQKPDLFVCHKAIYEARAPFNTGDNTLKKMRRSTDVFGVLANWKLRRFLHVVCEAKQGIGYSGLGETINYGAHLCFEEDGPVTVRLVLFDPKEFWLIECVKGVATSIEKCCWSQCGSFSLFRNFALRDPLIEALDDACKEFKLTVDENSFLGQGAFGVVFRVQNRKGKYLAMKIVSDEGDHVKHLKMQAEITINAKEKCPDYIVGIESNGILHYENKAGVLLQSDVGDHYSTLSGKQIIQALAALHSENILHGDCRVENIVNLSGKARWIDMRAAYLFQSGDMSSEKEKEMTGLRQSIQRAFSSS